MLLPSGGSEAAAQTAPLPPLLCTQVYSAGNTQATLLVVRTQGDNANDFQVARNYVPATGAFQQVDVLTGNLSTQVPIENHWVRSRNASGQSGWVACESYERISFIDASTPQDFRRPAENIAFGLDGNGVVGSATENGNAYGDFSGDINSVIVADASNAPELAPNGSKQIWRVRFRIAQAELTTLQQANGISWNLMQRGLASDPGGQLKISLIAQPNSSAVRVECFASDFNGPNDNIQTISSFDISTLGIAANGFTPWVTATCAMDDTGNAAGPNTGDGLQVIVNGVGDPEEFDADFGELLPSATNVCGANGGIMLDPNLFPGGIGNVLAVGSQPPCSNVNPADDFFKGHVDFAEIWTLAPITTPQPGQTCNGLPVTVDIGAGQSPTAGPDVILGTSGPDVIVALGGNDTICGEGGDDTINAGPGADFVLGGTGADSIFGLDGGDTLIGGAGNDVIVAGAGQDTVNGGVGNDVINGGPDADTLNGDAGDDEIFGQGGNDTITGGNGDDRLNGVDGADTIRGGGDDDVINGGNGNDSLLGDAGNDVVFGLGGNDQVSGGGGNDMLFGQLGVDHVVGGDNNDMVFGNENDDVLEGNGGNDTLNGGIGDDRLEGGSGADSLFGDGNLQQAGDDELDGGIGIDLILGFAGNDTIDAQDGVRDTVNGGPDTDTCTVDSGQVNDAVFNCEAP